MKKIIEINGNNFSSLDSFYDEIENKFTKNLNFKIGRNINAFNDILYGGFGIYEYEEEIELIWLNSEKSKKDLAWDETIKQISLTLKTCHPSNIKYVEEDLELAKHNKGETLFYSLVGIINNHKHIKLILG